MNYANRLGYSDVSPFEIVRRVSDKTIEIREMTAVLDETWKPEFHVGGFSAHCANQKEQRWIITSDEAAPVRRIRLQKTGYWKDKGGNKFALAEKPQRFYDYNF